MAQSVERYLGKVEVTGSSPVSSFEASHSGCFFYVREKLFFVGKNLFPVENIFFGRKGLHSRPIVLV